MPKRPLPLPTPQQFQQLRELRLTIIDTIGTIGHTRGTADGGDNIVRLTHGEDAHVRHAAIGTALNAVAFSCTDISQEKFMQMAAEAYQLKTDEDSDEDSDQGED
jgi:hypothetical protein